MIDDSAEDIADECDSYMDRKRFLEDEEILMENSPSNEGQVRESFKAFAKTDMAFYNTDGKKVSLP